jgi:phosphoglycerate dehydrogenase-like enzyme
MDLKRARVLVTATSYGKHDPRLKSELESLVGTVVYNPTGKPLSSAEVAALLPGVDGYIAGLDVIDRPALQAAERLKVIARYGVGVDGVDLKAAHEKNIVVTNTPGANSASVAELTLGLMLVLARQLSEAVSAARRGQFARLSGISLEGKTVGLVGLGAIGKEVARRLAGFDCRVLACEPVPDAEFAKTYRVEIVDLKELLHRSDFVSLHVPLMPETRAMVNSAFISNMRQGAHLVNTARGELVDEHALLEGLKSGHLRGAALDAFANEPPDPSHPLLALSQVVATPHLGAQTDGATNAMGWMSLEDCLAVLRGDEPAHRVA